MSDFAFVTHWLISERAGRLWELLADGLDRGDPLPWWGMVQAMGHDAESVWLRTNSGLGYRLNFRLFDLEEIPGHKLSFRADGDLYGRGTVTFTPLGPESVLTIDWHVTVRKGWMRRFHRVLRPLFSMAHSLVMTVGLRRLKKWVREHPE